MASKSRRRAWLGGLTSIALIAFVFSPGAAAGNAAQLLVNGGFEQGSSGWSASSGFSTSGCAAHSGSAAGVLTTSAIDQSAFVQQPVEGAVAQGGYTLTGYARLASGSPDFVNVALNWFDAGGRRIERNPIDFVAAAAWSQFSVSNPRSPAEAVRLAVTITLTSSGDAVLCLDDLSLEGPSLATPTVPPAATATLAPTATRTSQPATAAPPSESSDFVFVNGGFEEGTAGWRKFGGELRSVSTPRRSGAAAAAFVSTTTSTKWAFQLVRIEPAKVYEFQGYIMPGAGIAQTYLRISWYTAADGGGAALATDDSLTRLSGDAGAFVPLTTGPLSPPPAARTARLRVMLIPSGAGAATLHLDDFAFGLAAPGATPPPAASSTVAADDPPEATEPPQPAPAATAPPAERPTEPRVPPATATPSSDVLAQRQPGAPTPTPPTPLPAGAPVPPPQAPGSSTREIVLAAALVFLATLGGVYLLSRRRGA